MTGTILDRPHSVLAAVAKVGRHDAIATFDETFSRRLKRLGLQLHW